jgi:hypothetical protein
MDRESLSLETRRQIESELDRAAARTSALAAALLMLFKRAVLVVVVLLVVAFVVDYIQLQASSNALGYVSVKRYYAVGLKNGKTELMYAEPENQTCVNSMFPHRGYWPCWYLHRHNVKQIDI